MKLILGDCLEVMPQIADKSIDMILCDLPYGTTACKWDTVIPFEPLWEQYKRIIKDSGAIVLTASQPFTSAMVMSNIKMFKYEWIWEKEKGCNYITATRKPMLVHENVLVFYSKLPIYNPQMVKGKPYKKHQVSSTGGETHNVPIPKDKDSNGFRYPKNSTKIF
jgi:site-specific DNA-methyltransferase (adenine-specific)